MSDTTDDPFTNVDLRPLHAKNKFAMLELLTLIIAAYYEHECVGGTLHIVLEDKNWERDSVEWCLANARERGDLEGELIARRLLDLSEAERERFCNNKWRWQHGMLDDPADEDALYGWAR